MFYEEKFDKGDWWYRVTPKGHWFKFNYEQLLAKTVELQEEVDDIYYQQSMDDSRA